MKTIIFLLTIAITTNLFGQEKQTDSQTTDFKKVQISVSFSSDYCFRTLNNNDGSWSSDLVINSRNNHEISKLGYTTGLSVIFSLKKNIGIEAGIQYSNKGYQTKMQDLNFGDSIDPKYGFSFITSGSTPTQLKFIYSDYYIDIPLKINFSFGKKKISLITSAGLTTNIFIKETQTSVLVNSDRTDRKTNPTNFDYNKVNISPTISVGIDYKINSRMNLRIEPTFRYGVLKIIDAPVTGYLYSGGLNISYYFGL